MAIEVQQGTEGARRQLRVASGRCTAYINEPPSAGGAVDDAREIEVTYASSGRSVASPVEPCIFWRLVLPESNVPRFVLGDQYQTNTTGYSLARSREVPAAQVTRHTPGETITSTVREAGEEPFFFCGSGNRMRFRTSGCAKDCYIVRFFGEEGQCYQVGAGTNALATVEITAHRRIHYQYVQMNRGSGDTPYSLTNYQGENVLQTAVMHMRDRIGIELVQQGEAVNYPHHNASHFASDRSLFNYARHQPPGAEVAEGSIPERQIIIVALDTLPPVDGRPVPGQASGNAVAVACGYCERQRASEIIVLATLLHEIAHTFGLVPSGTGRPPTYNYGGLTRLAWQGSSYGHCSSRQCFMTPSVDGPTDGGVTPLEAIMRGDPITSFCGDDIFPGAGRTARGNCGSFLRIVPLAGSIVTIGTG